MIPAAGNQPHSAGYSAVATQFDGSTNWLNRNGDFTGISDGTTGLMSFWLRLDSFNVPNNIPFVFYGPNVAYGPRVVFNDPGYGGAGKLAFVSWSTGGGATRVKMISSTNFSASASVWHHVLLAWDTAATANCKMIVNGSADTPTITRNAGTAIYSGADHTVGAVETGAGQLFKGCVSEFYYAPNQWLDLTVAANILKFRSASGHPVSLGADGSLPTGVAPIYYSKMDSSNMAQNLGTGGAMTTHGSFTTASSSP